jgi:hypothetical protein
MGSQPGIDTLPRLLAVEVLLAEPEALQDDVLESCLYILRDRLTGAEAELRTSAARVGCWPDSRVKNFGNTKPEAE